MERSRLKTVIILILALANLFLLASLHMRKSAELESRRLATQHLVSLFAADNIRLDPDLISQQTPPSAKQLLRDNDLEQAAAAFFLGDSAVYADQGGDIHTYTGSSGAAMFRATGSFDIAGDLGNGQDAQDLCRQFCKEFSFGEPVFQLDDNGSGTASAVCRFGDFSVFNCTVTFTVLEHELTMVSGTLLPQSYSELAAKSEPLSASAALTAFQQFRRENGVVVSAITDLYLCYEMQSTPTAAMSISPFWCIVTDTVQYYVSCSTGGVRVA